VIAVVVEDFTTVIAPVCVTATVAEDGGESTGVGVGSAGVTGGVPWLIAVSLTDPLSRSACVTVYVAVHVVDAAGANVVTGQLIADRFAATDGATCTSVTFTDDNVTLPVFVTRKL
jgi:hypothetical protein